MTSTARLDGGYAHGMTLEVDEDASFVYVTVLDGVPRTVRGLTTGEAEELFARTVGQWECYVRDASQCAGQVFFCMLPLDRSSFGRGTPPPPPARVLARQDPP